MCLAGVFGRIVVSAAFLCIRRLSSALVWCLVRVVLVRCGWRVFGLWSLGALLVFVRPCRVSLCVVRAPLSSIATVSEPLCVLASSVMLVVRCPSLVSVHHDWSRPSVMSVRGVAERVLGYFTCV